MVLNQVVSFWLSRDFNSQQILSHLITPLFVNSFFLGFYYTQSPSSTPVPLAIDFWALLLFTPNHPNLWIWACPNTEALEIFFFHSVWDFKFCHYADVFERCISGPDVFPASCIHIPTWIFNLDFHECVKLIIKTKYLFSSNPNPPSNTLSFQ